MESAGDLELDLCSIVEWGDRWLVTFDATKTKLLSFNRHRDPLLVPVEMNSIELPGETSFRLLGLTFTPSMDWKPYIQPISKAASKKLGSLYRAQRFLTPESILYLDKSRGFDLLDRVQKPVVSLVGSGLSADLQAL